MNFYIWIWCFLFLYEFIFSIFFSVNENKICDKKKIINVYFYFNFNDYENEMNKIKCNIYYNICKI